MLLDAGRPADALVEFEATIKKEPNRFRGLYGGARAAEAAGQRARAIALYKQLLQVASDARHHTAPSSQHARRLSSTSSAPAARPAVLEPPRGWLGTASHLGPGLIISAAIVGSGELIVTPKVGAALGFSMLWFIILGCIVKVFVQIELARFAIVERVTTLEALNSVPGPRLRVSWLLWMWLFMYLGLVFQVAGLIGGCVLIFETMNFNVSRELLLFAIVGSGALLLVTGRYKVVEVGSTLMVAAFTISTIVAMIALQWTPYRVSSAQLIEGLKFQLPASFTVAFAAFGIIGVGASELIYYPYWCLEKGYARHIGPRDDSPEWRRRMLGWLRVLHADAMLSMVIYTGATIAFYILGAAVLHGQGLQVTDRELIETLGQMYRQTLGDAGAFDLHHWSLRRPVLHILCRDGLQCAAVRRRRRYFRRRALSRRGGEASCRPCGVRWLCRSRAGTVYFLFPQPVLLVLIGAVGQGLMLPFLGAAALYFHHRRLAGVIHSSSAWTLSSGCRRSR